MACSMETESAAASQPQYRDRLASKREREVSQ